MIVRKASPFPKTLPDGAYLVSAQWVSKSGSPEAAASEVAHRIQQGDIPQLSVVNFGDGFRWTYEVVDGQGDGPVLP